uniref:G-protein coupled receptors family 1 profile domain-containing protein n=1 Tax=Panagrellus redivivus TaxID=6233 RepID=A0A7E4UZ07_PANRE
MLLGFTCLSVFLNIYAVFLYFYVMPKSMSDFRLCLFLLSFYDTLLALTLGPVLDVVFQPPALAGVIRGPVTMFIYHNFGYNACKVVVCFAFYTISSILCIQDYGVMFRFAAILPNKVYYEFLNSIPGYLFIQGSTIAASGSLAALVYVVLYDEHELPTVMLNYENTTFVEYVPGETILIMGKMNTPIWYLIVVGVTLGILYMEGNSYILFFIANRVLKKYAANFSAQTYDLHRQFLYLFIIQITMPMLLIVAPVASLIYQRTLSGGMSKLQSDSGVLLTAAYSTVNVLLTIFFISPFRKFTRRITIDALLKLFGIKIDVTSKGVLRPVATESLQFNERRVQ